MSQSLLVRWPVPNDLHHGVFVYSRTKTIGNSSSRNEFHQFGQESQVERNAMISSRPLWSLSSVVFLLTMADWSYLPTLTLTSPLVTHSISWPMISLSKRIRWVQHHSRAVIRVVPSIRSVCKMNISTSRNYASSIAPKLRSSLARLNRILYVFVKMVWSSRPSIVGIMHSTVGNSRNPFSVVSKFWFYSDVFSRVVVFLRQLYDQRISGRCFVEIKSILLKDNLAFVSVRVIWLSLLGS